MRCFYTVLRRRADASVYDIILCMPFSDAPADYGSYIIFITVHSSTVLSSYYMPVSTPIFLLSFFSVFRSFVMVNVHSLLCHHYLPTPVVNWLHQSGPSHQSSPYVQCPSCLMPESPIGLWRQYCQSITVWRHQFVSHLPQPIQRHGWAQAMPFIR